MGLVILMCWSQSREVEDTSFAWDREGDEANCCVFAHQWAVFSKLPFPAHVCEGVLAVPTALAKPQLGATKLNELFDLGLPLPESERFKPEGWATRTVGLLECHQTIPCE